jgi:hypothetical protein
MPQYAKFQISYASLATKFTETNAPQKMRIKDKIKFLHIKKHNLYISLQRGKGGYSKKGEKKGPRVSQIQINMSRITASTPLHQNCTTDWSRDRKELPEYNLIGWRSCICRLGDKK